MQQAISVVTLACFMLSAVPGQGIAAFAQERQEQRKLEGAFGDFNLPSASGRVTDAHYTGSKTVVINIQDLHCHPEVQRNIVDILTFLDSKFALKKVYQEGAAGAVDTSWLGCIENKDLRQGIIDDMVNKGELTAAEYYSVAFGRSDLIAGLEDEKPFKENIVRLNEIMSRKDEIKGILAELDQALKPLEGMYYGARNRRIEQIRSLSRAGAYDTRKYYGFLRKYALKSGIDVNSYTNLTRYLDLVTIEKRLNYKKIGVELNQYILQLKQRIPYNAYRMLVEKTKNFSRTDELYTGILALDKDHCAGMDMAREFPNLHAYFAYIDISRKINPANLLLEEKKLLREVRERVSDTQSEREVAFILDFSRLLNDYFSNTIDADDYLYFARRLDEFKLLCKKYADSGAMAGLERYFDILNDYYRTNLDRNHCFVRNIFGDAFAGERPAVSYAGSDDPVKMIESLKDAGNIVVTVTGGFHTKGFTQLLKDKNISYLVITPHVTKDTEFSENVYRELMKEQGIFLAQSLPPALRSSSLVPLDVKVGTLVEERVIPILQDNERLPRQLSIPEMDARVNEFLYGWQSAYEKQSKLKLPRIHFQLKTLTNDGSCTYILETGASRSRFRYNSRRRKMIMERADRAGEDVRLRTDRPALLQRLFAWVRTVISSRKTVQVRLLKKSVRKIKNNPPGAGIERYQSMHPDRAARYLPTAQISAEDLPYPAELRSPRVPSPALTRIDDIPRVVVRMPATDVFLVSRVHNGSSAVVRLGFMDDGRPVALKMCSVRFGYGAREPDVVHAGAGEEVLAEYRGAKIADDLGIGPLVHGLYIDGDGKYNIVMDVVPGDFPRAPMASALITPATIRDLREIRERLINNGMDAGFDFQYFVNAHTGRDGAKGHIQLVDQMGGIYMQETASDVNSVTFVRKLAFLLIDAGPDVRSRAIRDIRTEDPGLLADLEKFFDKDQTSKDFRELKALCGDIEKGQALGRNIDVVLKKALKTIEDHLSGTTVLSSLSGQGLSQLMSILQSRSVQIGDKLFYLFAGVRGERFLSDEECVEQYGSCLDEVRAALETLKFDLSEIDIKVSAQDTELVMPGPGAYGLGTFIVSPLTGRMTYVMHRSFFTYLDLRGPPEGFTKETFTGLFAAHEGYEYCALNDTRSSIYKQFGSYLEEIVKKEFPDVTPEALSREIALRRTGAFFHRYIGYLAALPAAELKKCSRHEREIARQAALLDFARQAAQMEEVVRLYSAAHPEGDAEIIRAAFAIASARYGDKRSPSGESYFEHCLMVARNAAAWGAGAEAVAAGMLHKLPPGDLQDLRGRKKRKRPAFTKGEAAAITGMVERIRKISRLVYVDGERIESLRGTQSLQNYMNMVVQIAGDDQTMLLVFADKLQTVPRAGMAGGERQYRYQEIQHIYVPLAMRLDANDIAEDLRNEAFKLDKPGDYEQVIREVETVLGDTYECAALDLADMKAALAAEFERRGIKDAVIKFRIKTPFSVWEKRTSDRRPGHAELETLKDIMGLHAIVNDADIPAAVEFLSTWAAAQHHEAGEAKTVYMKAAEKGFSRFKYNFVDSKNRKHELCLFGANDYAKFQSGFIEETALKSPMPHWIYKVGPSVKEENGLFVQEMEFLSQGRQTQPYKVNQVFVTDNIRYTGRFAENMELLYNSLKGKIFVLYLYEDGKKGMSVLALPEGSVPADLVSKLEIDRLDAEYAGTTKVSLVKHGELPIGEEKPRQHLGEDRPLETGDIVALSPALNPVIFPNIAIVKHARTPRAALLASGIGKNRHDLVEKGKGIVIRHFRHITDIQKKLEQFGQSKGLLNLDELYLALALSIIAEDQLVSYLRSVTRKVIEVTAGNRVALLRDITTSFAGRNLNIVDMSRTELPGQAITYKFTVEELGNVPPFTNAQLRTELAGIEGVHKVSIRNVKPLYLNLQSLGENLPELIARITGVEFAENAACSLSAFLIDAFEKGALAPDDAVYAGHSGPLETLRSQTAALFGIDAGKVTVTISDNPELIQRDAWALATMMVHEGHTSDIGEAPIDGVTLYVHRVFLDGLKNKVPPAQHGLLKSLSSHEVVEYFSLNKTDSPAGRLFTRYLIDELHLTSAMALLPSQRTSARFHSYLAHLITTNAVPEEISVFDIKEQNALFEYAGVVASRAADASFAQRARSRRLDLAEGQMPPKWAPGLRIYYALLRDLARTGQDPRAFGTFTDLKYTISHVKKMGFNALFLMPLFESAAVDKNLDDSPYSVLSSYALDPRHIDWEATGLKGSTPAKRWAEFSRDIPADFALLAQELRMVQYAHVKVLRILQHRAARAHGYEEIEDLFGDLARFGSLGADDYRNMNSDVTRNDEYRLLYNIVLMEQYFARRQLAEAVAFAHEQGIFVGFDQPFFRTMEGVDAVFSPEIFERRSDGKIYPAGWNVGQEGGQSWGDIETQKGLAWYNWNELKKAGYRPLLDPLAFMIGEMGFDFVRGDALHYGFGREGFYEGIEQLCRDNGALFIPETLGCQDEQLVNSTCRKMGMLPIETLSGPGQGWKWGKDTGERWKKLFDALSARSGVESIWNPVHHDSEVTTEEYASLFDESTPREARARALYALFGLAMPDYSLFFGDEYGRKARLNIPGETHIWKQPSPYAAAEYDLSGFIKKINQARIQYPCLAEYGNLRDWIVSGSAVSFVRSSSDGKGVRVSINLHTGEFFCEEIVKMVGVPAEKRDVLIRGLEKASGHFLYDDPALGGWTVIAGSPHFDQRAGAALSNWGRDTMIALPGLCLPGKRYDVFRGVISNYMRFIRNGLLPNFVGDGKKPAYNSVDASLWLIWAVGEYIRESGDRAFLEARIERKYPGRGETSVTVRQLLDEIIAGYRNGTATEDGARIYMDGDFLIAAGNEDSQLTWMDAKPNNGKPVTSRNGKAVEINALWYNALRVMADVSARDEYADLAANVKKSFNETFWNEGEQCLFDTVDGNPGQGMKVRPNQVFAVALGLVDRDRSRQILKKVENELLTPYGLRTLSPKDPEYHSFHTDEASYHQGTVWPWLLGSYIEACVRVYGAHETLNILERHGCLDAFAGFIGELGSVPEIVDGDCRSIYHWNQRGCREQAWSVSAPLYALYRLARAEDVFPGALIAAGEAAGAVLSAVLPVTPGGIADEVRHFQALVLKGEEKEDFTQEKVREILTGSDWTPFSTGMRDELRTLFKMREKDIAELAEALGAGSMEEIGALLEAAVDTLNAEYRGTIVSKTIHIGFIDEKDSKYLFEDHRADNFIGVNRTFITVARKASPGGKKFLKNMFITGIAHELRHEAGENKEAFVMPDAQILARLLVEENISLEDVEKVSDAFDEYMETDELFKPLYRVYHQMAGTALTAFREQRRAPVDAAENDGATADDAAEKQQPAPLTDVRRWLSRTWDETVKNDLTGSIGVEFKLRENYRENIEQSARLLLPYSRLLSAVNILLRHDEIARFKHIAFDFHAGRDAVLIEGDTLHFSFKKPESMDTIEALRLFARELGWDFTDVIRKLSREAPYLLYNVYDFGAINVILHERMAGMGDLVFNVNTGQVLREVFPDKKIRLIFHSDDDLRLITETKLIKNIKPAVRVINGVEIIQPGAEVQEVDGIEIVNAALAGGWERVNDEYIKRNDVSIIYALGGNEKDVFMKKGSYAAYSGNAAAKIYVHELGFASLIQDPLENGDAYIGLGDDKVGMAPVSPIGKTIYWKKYPREKGKIKFDREKILKKFKGWTAIHGVLGLGHLQKTVDSEWGFLYAHTRYSVKRYFGVFEAARQMDENFAKGDKTFFLTCSRTDAGVQEQIRKLVEENDYNLFVFDENKDELVVEHVSKENKVTVVMDYSVPRKLFSELFLYCDDLPTLVTGQDNLSNILYLNQLSTHGRPFFWEVLPFQGNASFDFYSFVDTKIGGDAHERLRRLWELRGTGDESNSVHYGYAARMFSEPREYRHFFKKIATTIEQSNSFLPQMYYLMLRMVSKGSPYGKNEARAQQLIDGLGRKDGGPDALGINVSEMIEAVTAVDPLLGRFLVRPSVSIAQALVETGVFSHDTEDALSLMAKEALERTLHERAGELGFSEKANPAVEMVSMASPEMVRGKSGCILATFGLDAQVAGSSGYRVVFGVHRELRDYLGECLGNNSPPPGYGTVGELAQELAEHETDEFLALNRPVSSIAQSFSTYLQKISPTSSAAELGSLKTSDNFHNYIKYLSALTPDAQEQLPAHERRLARQSRLLGVAAGVLLRTESRASVDKVRRSFREYFPDRVMDDDAAELLAAAIERGQVDAERLSDYFRQAAQQGLFANGFGRKDGFVLIGELRSRSIVQQTYAEVLRTRSARKDRRDTSFNLPARLTAELQEVLLHYFRASAGQSEFRQLLWDIERGIVSLEKLLIEYAGLYPVPYYPEEEGLSDGLAADIQKQLAGAEGVPLPRYGVVSDVHGSYRRFLDLISSMLGRVLDPDKTLAEQGVTHETVSNGTAGTGAPIDNIFILGDLLDRGPDGMKVFALTQELTDTGLGKYVTGNHDLCAFMNLLGLHLPWYEGYKGFAPDYEGYGIGNVMRYLEARRAENPADVNDRDHWALKLSEYMAYADACQNGTWQGLEGEFKGIFTAIFGYDIDKDGEDVLNHPEDIFAADEALRNWWKLMLGHVGVKVYTGTRAAGKMSINWWIDRRNELEVFRDQYPAPQWKILAGRIDDIIAAQKAKMAEEVGRGNWEWAVIDAIMYRNYESAEWWALDWVYHKGWGSLDGGLLSQINRDKAQTGARPEEMLTTANYFGHPDLQELRDFYMKNFCLYRKDAYGNCYMHGFLPVDDDGDIAIGRINKNGVLEFYEKNGRRIKGFYYKGTHYRGRDIFKGFDRLAQDITGFRYGESSLSEIQEALALITSIYADVSTKIKPEDIVRYKMIGFNKIFERIGINRLFTGHNPISKLRRWGIDVMVNDDVTGKARLFNVDGEMSPGYVQPSGRGTCLNIDARGIAIKQYTSGDAAAPLNEDVLVPGDDFLKYVLNELLLIKAKRTHVPLALGHGIDRLMEEIDPLLGQFIVRPSIALARAVVGKGLAAAMPVDMQVVVRAALNGVIEKNRAELDIAQNDAVDAQLLMLTSDETVRDSEAYVLGTMGIERSKDAAAGKVTHTFILSAHQILLDASRNHGPPQGGFLTLFIEHEVDEYLALHNPQSAVGRLFTAHLNANSGIAAVRNSENFHTFILHLHALAAAEKATMTALEQRLANQALLLELAHELQGSVQHPAGRAERIAELSAAIARVALPAQVMSGVAEDADSGRRVDPQDWEQDYYRLADTLLESERTKEIFQVSDAHYKNLDIEAYRNKVRDVGKVMEKAPGIYGVFGLGFPFYGNVDIRKRIYRTLKAVRDGTRHESQFAERLIPDVDLLLVYGESDEGPWFLKDDVEIDSYLKDDFVRQAASYMRQWKNTFAELSRLKIINKLGENDYDPIREFIDKGMLNLDIVPVPRHIWLNMPVFIQEEDNKKFKLIRDLLYTSEPISQKGPDKDVVLQFRRNYALRQIAHAPVPFTEGSLLAHLREQHVYRHLLEMYEETRVAFDERHRAALRDAMEKGLVTINADGKLALTLRGKKFMALVEDKRRDIINEGYLDITPYVREETRFLARAAESAAQVVIAGRGDRKFIESYVRERFRIRHGETVDPSLVDIYAAQLPGDFKLAADGEKSAAIMQALSDASRHIFRPPYRDASGAPEFREEGGFIFGHQEGGVYVITAIAPFEKYEDQSDDRCAAETKHMEELVEKYAVGNVRLIGEYHTHAPYRWISSAPGPSSEDTLGDIEAMKQKFGDRVVANPVGIVLEADAREISIHELAGAGMPDMGNVPAGISMHIYGSELNPINRVNLAEVFREAAFDVPEEKERGQALGMSRDALIVLFKEYLRQINLFRGPQEQLQRMAVHIVNSLFDDAMDIHGAGIRTLLSDEAAEYAGENALLRDEMLRYPDELRSIGVTPAKENIIVRSVRGDLMPLGRVDDLLGYASIIEIENGKVVVYVTEGFYAATRNRAPPGVFNLLARHEIGEYQALHCPESAVGTAFSRYLSQELKCADIHSQENRNSENYHAYLRFINAPDAALLDYAAEITARSWLSGYMAGERKIVPASTEKTGAPDHEMVAPGKRPMYSSEREAYLDMIRKRVNPTGKATTMLYIGSAGDISTALSCTDAMKFIFVDALPFDYPDAGETEERDLYLKEKIEQGWSRSETLDIDVRGALWPIFWELGALGVEPGSIQVEKGDKISTVYFTLPGEHMRRMIIYYQIGSAYDEAHYSESLRTVIGEGIDVCMTKAFHHINIPPAVTGFIVNSLNPGGVILTDDSAQWMGTNSSGLTDITDLKIVRYEHTYGTRFGYGGLSILAPRDNVNAAQMHGQPWAVSSTGVQSPLLLMYQDRITLPARYGGTFAYFHVDSDGVVSVYTQEAYQKKAIAMSTLSDEERTDFYRDICYSRISENGLLKIEGRFRKKLKAGFELHGRYDPEKKTEFVVVESPDCLKLVPRSVWSTIRQVNLIRRNIESLAGTPRKEDVLRNIVRPQSLKVIRQYRNNRKFTGLMGTALSELARENAIRNDPVLYAFVKELIAENTKLYGGTVSGFRWLAEIRKPLREAMENAVDPKALILGETAASAAERLVYDPQTWMKEKAPDVCGTTILKYRVRIDDADAEENVRLNEMGVNDIVLLPYVPGNGFVKVGAVEIPRSGLRDVMAGTIDAGDGKIVRALCLEGLEPGDLAYVAQWIKETPALHGEVAAVLGLPFKTLKPGIIEIKSAYAATDSAAQLAAAADGFMDSSLMKGTALIYRPGSDGQAAAGDPILKKIYPWVDGVIDRRFFGIGDAEARLKELVLKVYEPAVLRKSAESVARPGIVSGENLMVSALRGKDSRKDPGIGELKDVETYFEDQLAKAGETVLPLLPLTRPAADSPFEPLSAMAGDEALIDLTAVREVNDLIGRKLVGRDSLFAGEEELKEVDRGKVNERKFAVLRKASELFHEQKDGERFKAYEAYVRGEAGWLDAYAGRMAASRVLGVAPSGVSDADVARARLNNGQLFEACVLTYKYAQWLFAVQMKDALAHIHAKGGKVQFWAEISRDNREASIEAIRHWFGFGFDGVRLSIKDAESQSYQSLSGIRDAISRCRPDALVTIKFLEGAKNQVALHEDFDFLRIRDYNDLMPGDRMTGRDIVEIDPVDSEFRPHAKPGTKIEDIKQFYGERIEKVKGAAGVLFTIGNAWGDDRTLMSRDENGRPRWDYRVPTDGEVDEKRVKGDCAGFARNMVARMAGRPLTREASYERGYQIGRTLFQGVCAGEKENVMLQAKRTFDIRDAKGALLTRISGNGLYCLRAVCQYINAGKANGEGALQYHSSAAGVPFSQALAPLVRALAEIPGENRKYWQAFLSHIEHLDDQAVHADDAEAKVRCAEELFGLVRGIAEDLAEAKYLASGKNVLPDNAADKEALRALLSLADSLGVSIDALDESRGDGTADGIPQPVIDFYKNNAEIAALLAVSGKDDPVGSGQLLRSVYDRAQAKEAGVLPAVVYAKTLLKAGSRQGKATGAVDKEVRDVINPLLWTLMKRDTAPGLQPSASASAEEAFVQTWAASELLALFDMTAERKIPDLQERTKEMFKIFTGAGVRAIKAAG